KVALERDTISLIEGNYTGVATNSAAGQFSDYIANGGKDAQIISKMLTSQKTFLGYDDILALFWLHDVELPNVIKGENSTETEIAEAANLLNVLIETIPTLAKTINTPNHTKTLFHKNLETLHNYQYNSINLHNITYSKKVLIPLSNHHFLEFSENGLFIFDNLPKPKWDYKQFVENGYICGVRQIHSALESWETYFERGRRKSSEPFILQFANMGEFENSLYFLDYADILDNENYIVSLKNQHLPAFADYLPKVDAAFLFAENTRVFTTFNGLIDQLTGLCNALNICEKNNLELYINDFMFDDYPVFESFQADKIMSAPINSRRFSKMFSRRLRWRIVNFRMFHKQPAIFIISAAEKLFYLGLQELYSVVFYDLRFVQKRRYPPIFERLNLNPEFIVICCLNLEQCNNLTINKIPQKPLIISALPAGTSRKTFEGRTEYPTMSATDTNNHKIAQLAKSHDLIAIHLRRGDHMIGSHYSKSKDSLDYKIGIDLLHNHEYFTKFKNKHLLVFSDDMDWTKKHAEQFAFQTFGENLTYVDWNRHFDSYKDMQLMSMCKVIIRGIGRFAATAFVLSTTSEFLIECRELQITDSSGKITKLQEDF
ncbi:MAG: alpha-1,2-fucosyltransferase, partial [Defluviitaleaceae bacterium]|nr:alpha-1,2-fucosyltransferase [Defluviitaleaceae bacterium]